MIVRMIEAILYYLLIFDCLTYVVMTFTRGKLHDRVMHWPLMDMVPFKKIIAFGYVFLVVWLGFSLYRLGIVF